MKDKIIQLLLGAIAGVILAYITFAPALSYKRSMGNEATYQIVQLPDRSTAVIVETAWEFGQPRGSAIGGGWGNGDLYLYWLSRPWFKEGKSFDPKKYVIPVPKHVLTSYDSFSVYCLGNDGRYKLAKRIN